MAYERLNLSEGDIISSAHIHHIEEGISAFEAQFGSMKDKLATILRDKTIMANKDESVSDLLKKVSTLRAPQVPVYEYEDIIDISKTVRSGQIQLVCTNTSIEFSCRGTTGFVIDWGDGTSQTINATTATTCNHTYEISDVTQRIITIAPKDNGRLNTWAIGGSDKTSILSFVAKDVFFQTAYAMFSGCTSLKYVDLIGGSFGTSDLNGSMYSLVFGCTSLERISGAVAWSSITNMTSAFRNCPKLKFIDLGDSWNTINVTAFTSTFHGASSLISLPYFRTDSVTDMSNCFYGCTLLETINGDIWNLENCTNIDTLFYKCTSLTTIPELKNTQGIQSCNSMFRECLSLVKLHDNQHTLDLSKSNIVNKIFMNCTALEEIPNLKLDSATSAIMMFCNCNNLSIVPEIINFPNVTGVRTGTDILEPETTESDISGLGGLFLNCSSLVTAPTIVAPKCLNICSMYKGCENLINVPENFNFPSVLMASAVFYGCRRMQTAPRFLNIPAVQRLSYFFDGCSSMVVAPSSYENDTFQFDDLIYCNSMFNNCTALQIAPTEIIFPKAALCTELFKGCTSLLKAPSIVQLDTTTDISSMFSECVSLQYPPSKIIAPRATNTSSLFYQCHALLVCPEIEAPNTTNIGAMFYYCSALTTTIPYNFPLVNRIASLFSYTKNLKIIDELNIGGISGTENITSEVNALERLAFPKYDGYASVPFLSTSQTLLRTVTGEIDCYNSSQNIRRIVASPYIEGVLTLKAPRADVNINNRKGITGIRITDPQTTMNNLTVTNCGLSATAINQLFTDLPTIPSARVVSVAGNIGASTCDTSIATAKGWTVVTT